MHLQLGVSYKASLQLGFQPLEKTFSAVSALPPNGSCWNKLNKVMELIRGGAWLEPRQATSRPIPLTMKFSCITCQMVQQEGVLHLYPDFFPNIQVLLSGKAV